MAGNGSIVANGSFRVVGASSTAASELSPTEVPLDVVIPDVIFDHGAVLLFADTCSRAAARLDDMLRARHGAAERAAKEWRGVKREQFDRDRHWLADTGCRLSDRLRRVANSARAASDHAHAEQARRVAARDELARQRAAEAEARAQAAAQAARGPGNQANQASQASQGQRRAA